MMMSFNYLSILLIVSPILVISYHTKLSTCKVTNRRKIPANQITKLHADVNPMEGTPFETLYALTKAREMCPPQVCVESLLINIFRSFQLNEGFLHWAHPILMTLALFSLGGIGFIQGKKIRDIRLSTSRTSADVEEFRSAQSLHPSLMSGLLFFVSIGIQSGLGSLLVLNKPILESPHAATALVVTILLIFQAILSYGIPSAPIFREVHGKFGLLVAVAFILHIFSGVLLGTSF